MKNNKLLIVLLSVLLVCACSKVVTQKHIEQANSYCEDKEGVFSITVLNEIVEVDVICKNGDTKGSSAIHLSAN